MTHFLVLSTSLRPRSNSRTLARAAVAILTQLPEATAELVDARTLDLAAFDDDAVYDCPGVHELTGRLAEADAIVLASPIYNWSTSAMLKAIIECTGSDDTGRKIRAWEDKLVTFLCAGGVAHSYLAYLPVANSLMLDYKCIINPYVVYCTEDDFDGDALLPEPAGRLDRALGVAAEVARLLVGRTYASKWTL